METVTRVYSLNAKLNSASDINTTIKMPKGAKISSFAYSDEGLFVVASVDPKQKSTEERKFLVTSVLDGEHERIIDRLMPSRSGDYIKYLLEVA